MGPVFPRGPRTAVTLTWLGGVLAIIGGALWIIAAIVNPGGVVWPGQTQAAPTDGFNNAKRIGTNAPTAPAPKAPAGRHSDTLAETMMKSFGRQIANQAGREVVRGILGSILKG